MSKRRTIHVDVKCPYCDFVNEIRHDVTEDGPTFIYCDNEEGGCDQRFIYQVKLKAAIAVSPIHFKDI